MAGTMSIARVRCSKEAGVLVVMRETAVKMEREVLMAMVRMLAMVAGSRKIIKCACR
jgi:hypothetical protein